MKKLIEIVICIAFLYLFQNCKVIAQSVTAQFVQTSSLNASQQIDDLIKRSIARWQSEGYTVVPYTEFKTSNPLPSEIISRFQENLVRYASREFGGEHNSFVIYKREYYYSTIYILQVVEDCPGGIIPNKFTSADTYSLQD